MRLTIAAFTSLLLFVSTANADFVVWLSDKSPAQSPVPGMLDATLASAGASGSLYLYGDGSSELSGLSLDLATTGNAIKFTSAVVNNPASRWSFLDGPLVVGDSLITNIGGAAIPPGAVGVGGPVADEVPGAGFLLATIGYTGLGNATSNSNLELRVGSNLIADYEGNAAMVRLGGPNAPLVDGTVTPNVGAAGTIKFGAVVTNTAPVVTSDIISATVPALVSHQMVATDDGPLSSLSWTISNFSGPGVPPHAPTISSTGLLTWDTNGGAKGGQYIATVMATDAGSPILSGQGTLTINLTVPEPASFGLASLAMIGLVGFARRRG